MIHNMKEFSAEAMNNKEQFREKYKLSDETLGYLINITRLRFKYESNTSEEVLWLLPQFNRQIDLVINDIPV